MYIVEFERCQPDSIIVRVIDPTANGSASKIIAEEIYRGTLPDGLSLKADVAFAVLRLLAIEP